MIKHHLCPFCPLLLPPIACCWWFKERMRVATSWGNFFTIMIPYLVCSLLGASWTEGFEVDLKLWKLFYLICLAYGKWGESCGWVAQLVVCTLTHPWVFVFNQPVMLWCSHPHRVPSPVPAYSKIGFCWNLMRHHQILINAFVCGPPLPLGSKPA